MKAELRGLSPETAKKVGLRLLAAGRLLDSDPEAAYAQAKVARRLAARLPIIRAAVAESAYAAGDYQGALTDYRALRRMSGGDEYLPVIADCERAVGRPEEALRLAREAASARLDAASQIEMTMVEAGARSDMGQRAEAIRLLERKIRETQHQRVSDTSKARLRYAYAEQLLAADDRDSAREWFATAAKLDRDGVTDADERVAELDGVIMEFYEEDLEDDDSGHEFPADEQAPNEPDSVVTGEEAPREPSATPDTQEDEQVIPVSVDDADVAMDPAGEDQRVIPVPVDDADVAVGLDGPDSQEEIRP